jgi:soluble lytic murein transglycosylase
MSPYPAATVASRQEAARRAAARRRAITRRRSILVLVGVGAVILAVILIMPLFRKAVNEFSLPLAHQDVIRQQAAAKHLDPALIAAVIYAETKFDPRPSPAGAQGLM